ncbi:MAG: type II toxin-antitoxin system Phd/YefM family antitoxin [Pseudomonadota bacterium]
MTKHVTATEAKNRFGELLEAVNTEPVFIRKNGRDVAVLISKADFEARDEKAAKKALVQQMHEESIAKYSAVYEKLAK